MYSIRYLVVLLLVFFGAFPPNSVLATCLQPLPVGAEPFHHAGKAILDQLSPAEQAQLVEATQKLAIYYKVVRPVGDDQQFMSYFAAVQHLLARGALRAEQAYLGYKMEDRRIESNEPIDQVACAISMDEGEFPPEAASRWARYKKIIATVCGGTVAVAGLTLEAIAENPWIKVLSLATSAAIVYASAGIIGPLVPLPATWSWTANIAAKAAVGAGIVFEGNLLLYSAIDIGLQPNSPINLIAMGSWMNLVGGFVGTYGNLLFFNQKPIWTVWVGLGATAFVSSLQIGYALMHQ